MAKADDDEDGPPKPDWSDSDDDAIEWRCPRDDAGRERAHEDELELIDLGGVDGGAAGEDAQMADEGGGRQADLATGTESPARGADADKRALLLMRRLILEREEISLSELEQELREHGLEMEEGGMSLEEVLQYLSDKGYASPHQWLVADAVRVRGSERVQERVVMLV